MREYLVEKQIFLGLLGFKNFIKKDAKDMSKTFEEAGIRPVLFSKEGVLETLTIGRDFGFDSDFNAWISLANNKLLRENIMQNVVLPNGVDKIRDHIRDVDTIPL